MAPLQLHPAWQLTCPDENIFLIEGLTFAQNGNWSLLFFMTELTVLYICSVRQSVIAAGSFLGLGAHRLSSVRTFLIGPSLVFGLLLYFSDGSFCGPFCWCFWLCVLELQTKALGLSFTFHFWVSGHPSNNNFICRVLEFILGDLIALNSAWISESMQIVLFLKLIEVLSSPSLMVNTSSTENLRHICL